MPALPRPKPAAPPAATRPKAGANWDAAAWPVARSGRLIECRWFEALVGGFGRWFFVVGRWLVQSGQMLKVLFYIVVVH